MYVLARDLASLHVVVKSESTTQTKQQPCQAFANARDDKCPIGSKVNIQSTLSWSARIDDEPTSTGGDASGLDTRPLQVDHGITAKCGEKGSNSSLEIRPSRETLFSVSYLVTSQGSKSRASWMMSR